MEKKIVRNVVNQEFSFRVARNGQTAEKITITAESKAAALLRLRSMYPDLRPGSVEDWREEFSLNLQEKAKAAMKFSGITQEELAQKVGTFQQGISRRLKTGKFTLEELEEMAQAMGGHFRAYFVFGDEEGFDDDAWRF